ncbi:hypothetical protein ScPMuIL_006778 [Solemya velum]
MDEQAWYSLTEESDTDSAETVIRHPGLISPITDDKSQVTLPTVEGVRARLGVCSHSTNHTSNMDSGAKDESDDEHTLSQYTLPTVDLEDKNGDEDQTLFTISTLDGRTVITEGQVTLSEYENTIPSRDGGSRVQKSDPDYEVKETTSEDEPSESQYAVSTSDEESTRRVGNEMSLPQYTLQSMDDQKICMAGQTILSQHTLPSFSDQSPRTEEQTTLSQYTLPSMDDEKLENSGQAILSQYTLPSVGNQSDIGVGEQTAPSQYTLTSMDGHKEGQTTLSQYTLLSDATERDKMILSGSPVQQNTSSQTFSTNESQDMSSSMSVPCGVSSDDGWRSETTGTSDGTGNMSLTQYPLHEESRRLSQFYPMQEQTTEMFLNPPDGDTEGLVQYSIEDSSVGDAVVQSAIMEVSKDFISGTLSSGKYSTVDSDSMSDGDQKSCRADGAVYARYPDSANGMSDSDWNPYATESDTGHSPRSPDIIRTSAEPRSEVVDFETSEKTSSCGDDNSAEMPQKQVKEMPEAVQSEMNWETRENKKMISPIPGESQYGVAALKSPTVLYPPLLIDISSPTSSEDRDTKRAEGLNLEEYLIDTSNDIQRSTLEIMLPDRKKTEGSGITPGKKDQSLIESLKLDLDSLRESVQVQRNPHTPEMVRSTDAQRNEYDDHEMRPAASADPQTIEEDDRGEKRRISPDLQYIEKKRQHKGDEGNKSPTEHTHYSPDAPKFTAKDLEETDEKTLSTDSAISLFSHESQKFRTAGSVDRPEHDFEKAGELGKQNVQEKNQGILHESTDYLGDTSEYLPIREREMLISGKDYSKAECSRSEMKFQTTPIQSLTQKSEIFLGESPLSAYGTTSKGTPLDDGVSMMSYKSESIPSTVSMEVEKLLAKQEEINSAMNSVIENASPSLNLPEPVGADYRFGDLSRSFATDVEGQKILAPKPVHAERTLKNGDDELQGSTEKLFSLLQERQEIRERYPNRMLKVKDGDEQSSTRKPLLQQQEHQGIDEQYGDWKKGDANEPLFQQLERQGIREYENQIKFSEIEPEKDSPIPGAYFTSQTSQMIPTQSESGEVRVSQQPYENGIPQLDIAENQSIGGNGVSGSRTSSLSSQDSDSLTARVNKILFGTAHLDNVEYVPAEARTETMPYSSYASTSLDYSKLQRDLHEIQSSLNSHMFAADNEKQIQKLSPALPNVDPKDLSLDSSKKSDLSADTVSKQDSENARARKLMWDHAADYGYTDTATGVFLGTMKDIETETDASLSQRFSLQDYDVDVGADDGYSGLVQNHGLIANSSGEETNPSESKTNDTNSTMQEINDLVDDEINDNNDTDELLRNIEVLGDRNFMEASIRSPSAQDKADLGPSGLADKVFKILTRDSPQKQAHGILEKALADEFKMRQKFAEQLQADSSYSEGNTSMEHKSFELGEQDVRKQLNYSMLSSVGIPSPNKGNLEDSSINVPTGPFSALGNAKTFLSSQLQKMSKRDFDKSVELRSPHRKAIACYPLYQVERGDPKQGKKSSEKRDRRSVGSSGSTDKDGGSIPRYVELEEGPASTSVERERGLVSSESRGGERIEKKSAVVDVARIRRPEVAADLGKPSAVDRHAREVQGRRTWIPDSGTGTDYPGKREGSVEDEKTKKRDVRTGSTDRYSVENEPQHVQGRERFRLPKEDQRHEAYRTPEKLRGKELDFGTPKLSSGEWPLVHKRTYSDPYSIPLGRRPISLDTERTGHERSTSEGGSLQGTDKSLNPTYPASDRTPSFTDRRAANASRSRFDYILQLSTMSHMRKATSPETATPSPESDSSGHRRRDPIRLRPYRPSGSKDLYYTESGDDTSSITDSITTLESTHTGSDDALGPHIPAQYLGSRTDNPRNVPGIYSKRHHGLQPLSPRDSLSTIEEKSVSDDRDKISDTASEKIRKSLEREVTVGTNGQQSTMKDSGIDTRVRDSASSDSLQYGRDKTRMNGISHRPQRAWEDTRHQLATKESMLDEERDLGASTRSDPGTQVFTELLPDYSKDISTFDPREFELYQEQGAERLKRRSRSRSDTDLTALSPREGGKSSSPMYKAGEFEMSAQPSPIYSYHTTLNSPSVDNILPSSAAKSQGSAKRDIEVNSKPIADSNSKPSQYPYTIEPRHNGRQSSEKKPDQQSSVNPFRVSSRNEQLEYEKKRSKYYLSENDKRNQNDFYQPGAGITENVQKTREDLLTVGRNHGIYNKSEDQGRSQRMLGRTSDPPMSMENKIDSQGQPSIRDAAMLSRPTRKPELERRSVPERTGNPGPDNNKNLPSGYIPLQDRQKLLQPMDEEPLTLNEMWQRLHQSRSESESSLETSRVDALSRLLENPAQCLVQNYFEQKDLERDQKKIMEEKMALEREQRRQDLRNQRGSSESESNGSYTEILVEKNKVSKHQKVRETPKRVKKKPPPEQVPVDNVESLYSIPEDISFDSMSPAVERHSPLKTKAHRHKNVIDPLMNKLKGKIQKQRDKIDKERMKEIKRLEKLKKLEMLLNAKHKGKLSDQAIDVELHYVSSTSTSLTTDSSQNVTSDNTLTKSSASDSDVTLTSQESTTAKDSSLELQKAKFKKPKQKQIHIADVYYAAMQRPKQFLEKSDSLSEYEMQRMHKQSKKTSSESKSSQKTKKHKANSPREHQSEKKSRKAKVHAHDSLQKDISEDYVKYQETESTPGHRRMKEVGTMYPSPIVQSPRRHRKYEEVSMVSEAIQTSLVQDEENSVPVKSSKMSKVTRPPKSNIFTPEMEENGLQLKDALRSESKCPKSFLFFSMMSDPSFRIYEKVRDF